MTKISKEIETKLETYIGNKLKNIEYYEVFEIYVKKSNGLFEYITKGNYTEIIEYIKKQCLYFFIDGKSDFYRVLGIELNNISGVEFDLKDL